MSNLSFPRELWLQIHTSLDGDSFQNLALTSKWHFQQYKELEALFLRYIDEIPASHTLVNRPKTYDPMLYFNWLGTPDVVQFKKSDEVVPFKIHKEKPSREDIANLSSQSNKKVHFNFQNRPQLRYVVDFEEWNVTAVKIGDHVRNTNRHSDHRLVLDHKTNQLDEICIEDDENGLRVVWKKPNPKDNIVIDMIALPIQLHGLFTCWLSDRPKSAYDVFMYAESDVFDNVLVYYVNWKARKLELVSIRCFPFDNQPMAMKNSLFSGICNAYFLGVMETAIYVRNLISGRALLINAKEPQLLHYDNRYFIYADGEEQFVADVVEAVVRPLTPKHILRGIPSIHMVTVSEEKGVECWIPGWASLGQLKAGESQEMCPGSHFGRLINGELIFNYDSYEDEIDDYVSGDA